MEQRCPLALLAHSPSLTHGRHPVVPLVWQIGLGLEHSESLVHCTQVWVVVSQVPVAQSELFAQATQPPETMSHT